MITLFFLEKEKSFLEKGKASVFKNTKSLQLMLDNFMLTERGRTMAIFFFSGFVHNCALKKILIFEMLIIIKCNEKTEDEIAKEIEHYHYALLHKL